MTFFNSFKTGKKKQQPVVVVIGRWENEAPFVPSGLTKITSSEKELKKRQKDGTIGTGQPPTPISPSLVQKATPNIICNTQGKVVS